MSARLIGYQDTLSIRSFEFTLEHKDEGYWGKDSTDIVTCKEKGRQRWKQALPHPDPDWRVFWDAHFLGITDKFIGVVQLYEHSRGGHTDPTLSVLNLSGKVLWSFQGNGFNMNGAVLFDRKIWFITEQFRLLGNGFINDEYLGKAYVLSSFDIESGTANHKLLPVCPTVMGDVQNDEVTRWGSVILSKKRGEVYLKFSAKSFGKGTIMLTETEIDRRKKSYLFAEYIRQDEQKRG